MLDFAILTGSPMKKYKTMGMDNQNQITAIQYAELNGLDWDGVKSALYRNGFGSGKHMVLKPEMIDAINTKKTGVPKPVKNKAVVSATKEQQPVKTENKEPKPGAKTGVEPVKETNNKTTKETKTAEWWQVVTVCFLVSILSVSLTTLGLGMFAKWAGYILGGMFALTLISSLLVARNKQKGDTSQSALNTVLYMEIGASFLHSFTFYVLLPECNEYLRVTAAAIMALFVAFLSYKAVQFVRNYNAEI